MILRSTDIRSALAARSRGVSLAPRRKQRGFIIDPYRFAAASSYETANLVMYIDAGDAASYSGSGQAFANLVAAPADGAAQADYDWWLGAGNTATATDPTWNSAGSASYFSFDGGDYFTFQDGSTSTTFFNSMHKAGARYTIELWMYATSFAGNSWGAMLDTGHADFGAAVSNRGIAAFPLWITGSNQSKPGLIVGQASPSNSYAFQQHALTGLSTSTIYMVAMSIYEGGGNVSFLYRNGNYDQVTGPSNTFSVTYTSPPTNNVTVAPRIGVRGDANFTCNSGTRIYLMRVYNTNLSKAQLDGNWNGTKARFGL